MSDRPYVKTDPDDPCETWAEHAARVHGIPGGVNYLDRHDFDHELTSTYPMLHTHDENLAERPLWWQFGYRTATTGKLSPLPLDRDPGAFDDYQAGYEAGCRALEAES